jgi:thioredoxin reductase (NADPH)
MAETHHAKVLILGSGPAGYTAAIYTARANLKPLLITGMELGGQMSITTDVENFPGFADVIQGPWLMEQMRAQAEHVGTRMINDLIVKVELARRPFRCTGDSGNVYTCDALIITTGAQARWLGLPSEKHFQGFGVSACATCDGFFYKNKRVAVVGGGNTAVEESLYLAQLASSVTLIHRRDTLRAEKMLQSRLMAHEKIKVVWDSVIEEVKGHDEPRGVTALKLRNVKTNAVSEMPVDGLFIAIGHDPATSLFRGQLEMDSEGYIVTTPGSTATAIPGVFAAGDVQDKVFRQAVTAAGTGCMAALEADRFLAAAGETAHAAE